VAGGVQKDYQPTAEYNASGASSPICIAAEASATSSRLLFFRDSPRTVCGKVAAAAEASTEEECRQSAAFKIIFCPLMM